MTRVLVCGDPHIKTDNVCEVNLFLDKIEELAKNKNPDVIVILGDVLHTHERVHTVALNKAYEFVDKMRKVAKTYVLVGNHDYCNNQQYLTENHWMNGMKEWDNVVIVDKALKEMFGKYEVILCPYVPNGRFIDALSTLGNWRSANLIFAHQEFKGCKMGAIISEDGDEWDLTFPEIISGHIHSNQRPQKNIYYPGSAMQNAFGESERNIISCIEIIGNSYVNEEIDLGLPRKKIVYMNVENVEDYKPPEGSDEIKVTVSGVYEEFKALKKTNEYKKLIEKGVKVVFKQKKLDIKEEYKEVEGLVDFKSILLDIVNMQKDSMLVQAYELVVNGKDMNDKDVIFLDVKT